LATTNDTDASLQGLFFIEGRRSAVRRLRRRWDNFHRTGKAVELSNSNPFDVSSALLNFLELLPVPLLEFQGKKDTSIDFSRVKVRTTSCSCFVLVRYAR